MWILYASSGTHEDRRDWVVCCSENQEVLEKEKSRLESLVYPGKRADWDWDDCISDEEINNRHDMNAELEKKFEEWFIWNFGEYHWDDDIQFRIGPVKEI